MNLIWVRHNIQGNSGHFNEKSQKEILAEGGRRETWKLQAALSRLLTGLAGKCGM